VLRDVLAAIQAQHGSRVTLVHGAARGADLLAVMQARLFGWTVEAHPAEWKVYGKRAGFVRNQAMVKRGADLCVAFIKGGSKGATMCADLAQQAGIETHRYVEVPATPWGPKI
jgi:hypothetical protein